MRQPADLLILDEPTNDLDIPTLEVLEDSLAEFDGALVLVTHDRFMLERVSTVILALDGQGRATAFADYAQWEAAARSAAGSGPRNAAPSDLRGVSRAAAGAQAERTAARERSRPRRLSYLEQREWDGIERAILDAEGAVDACRREAEDPAIAADPTALQERYAALEAARAEVDRLYDRWAELGAKQEA
jgi:ATP-binding cassette subfamily F protein uup